MGLKWSSAKWRPFRLGFNVLIHSRWRARTTRSRPRSRPTRRPLTTAPSPVLITDTRPMTRTSMATSTPGTSMVTIRLAPNTTTMAPLVTAILTYRTCLTYTCRTFLMCTRTSLTCHTLLTPSPTCHTSLTLLTGFTSHTRYIRCTPYIRWCTSHTRHIRCTRHHISHTICRTTDNCAGRWMKCYCARFVVNYGISNTIVLEIP